MDKSTTTLSATTEAPCEANGGAHCYHSEEEYDDDGNMLSWDDYCCMCGRWRDWSKDLYLGE